MHVCYRLYNHISTLLLLVFFVILWPLALYLPTQNEHHALNPGATRVLEDPGQFFGGSCEWSKKKKILKWVWWSTIVSVWS